MRRLWLRASGRPAQAITGAVTIVAFPGVLIAAMFVIIYYKVISTDRIVRWQPSVKVKRKLCFNSRWWPRNAGRWQDYGKSSRLSILSCFIRSTF